MATDPTPAAPFRIGTRGSPLALVQARMVAAALADAHHWAPGAVRIVPVTTTGDRVQDRPLAEIGGKALWTKELDRALLNGEIDCAVHSMKDVETIRPDAIVVAAMLARAAVEDRLLGAPSVAALPPGAVVGTSSPRRAAQLRRLRPDVVPVPFRGNVATRIAKLEAGEVAATLLAAAGLDRLGLADVGAAVPLDTMLPAPAQGAVGTVARAPDTEAREAIGAVRHDETLACVMAERALLAGLGGDCRSPVAALARMEGLDIRLRAEILSPDGASHVAGDARMAPGDPAPAVALARDLLGRADPALAALFAGG